MYDTFTGACELYIKQYAEKHKQAIQHIQDKSYALLNFNALL